MKSLAAASQNTADSIFVRQNEPYLLDCLLEQRKLYTRAKKMQAGQSAAVLVFAVFSAVSAAIGSELLTAIYGLLSVVLLIANKYYGRHIENVKRDAAIIQQFFDVVLFSSEIGNTELEWDYFPSRRDMARVIGDYTGHDRESVKNWYSDYSKLSGNQQVFYCQSENVRWSQKLINNYRSLQIKFWVGVCLAVLTVFVVFNPSIIKAICVCTWLIPIGEYAASSAAKIKKSCSRHEGIEKDMHLIENMLCKDENVVSSLIDLQRKIFQCRCESVLIPDWFYSRRKSIYQKTEDRIARNISNS